MIRYSGLVRRDRFVFGGWHASPRSLWQARSGFWARWRPARLLVGSYVVHNYFKLSRMVIIDSFVLLLPIGISGGAYATRPHRRSSCRSSGIKIYMSGERPHPLGPSKSIAERRVAEGKVPKIEKLKLNATARNFL